MKRLSLQILFHEHNVSDNVTESDKVILTRRKQCQKKKEKATKALYF